MAEISQLVATFILNATWQITVITALAFLCAKLLHRAPSQLAHAVWIAALGACLVVPTITVVLQHGKGSSGTLEIAPVAQRERDTEPRGRAIPVSFHSLSRSVSFSPVILNALLWAYGIALFFGAARLAWFGYETRRVCQLAYPRALPPALARIVEHSARSFSLPCVSVLCTAELSGPATVGFKHPLLLLPETFFLGAFAEDDLSSAISHELAHVLRRDFLFNLLYQVASLPACFHPCVALILSRIAQTREFACDEIAARMMPSTVRYATSLLHIAQSMVRGVRPNYALGLFDTNALEERIMNILKTNDTRTKTRIFQLIAACLIGAASIGLSAFSLRPNNAGRSEDLTPFAGTWEAKYQGTTFFTVQLTLAGGSLGGTCVLGERWTIVDGELIPDGSELSTHKILEATAAGKKVVLKIAGNKIGEESSSEVVLVELTLTARDQAEGRVVVGSNSDTPSPQKTPWHFQRTGR